MIKKRLFFLFFIWCAAVTFFMLYNSQGSWNFLLNYRGQKVLALTLIGSATGVATVALQTITHNRILTPSVMGFDSMYLLINIIIIAIFGAQSYLSISDLHLFMIELVALMLTATLIFVFLLNRLGDDLLRLLLMGVIIGLLCRSLTEFFSRILNPEDFSVYQGAAFAQFNNINSSLLMMCAILMSLVFLLLWKYRHTLDLLALNKATAINLGIPYRRSVSILMMLIAALVSLSTALVGPVMFLGLLVSAIVYRLFPTAKHAILFSASTLIGSSILILGQAVFERVLGFESTLSVVIEFFGGIIFIFFLFIRGKHDLH